MPPRSLPRSPKKAPQMAEWQYPGKELVNPELLPMTMSPYMSKGYRIGAGKGRYGQPGGNIAKSGLGDAGAQHTLAHCHYTPPPPSCPIMAPPRLPAGVGHAALRQYRPPGRA